jgi:hypothetical protein
VRDEERGAELARKSAGKGSRYGQFSLGFVHYWDALDLFSAHEGQEEGFAQAVALYRLAAAQGLDEAQVALGDMYFNGEFGLEYHDGSGLDDEGEVIVTEEDYAEGLRLYKLAAAQGHPKALYKVAESYENCSEDVAEAIRWYRRAQAAGHPYAEQGWQNLISDGGGGDDGDDDDT